MSECTVQLWYNKQRIKQNGNVSLYLQIIVGGEHSEIKLNSLEWPANKLDWDKKILKPRTKEDQDIVTYNAIIERERSKYWTVIMNFLKQNLSFSLADIFREVNLYKNGHLFCDFMEQAIKDRQKTLIRKDMIKDGTARNHRATLRAFRSFLNHEDIDITRINGDLLENFADHLRVTINDNTTWLRIQNIKSVLSYAFRHKIMINHDYKRFTLAKGEPNPTWLDEVELNKLLDLYTDPTIWDEMKRNLRAFLFAAFTGLRISDLSRWNKSWIQDDNISFIPEKRRKSSKNPKPVIIPILPIARDFINDLTAESFELPKDQVYNRGLKTIAKKAKINKDITSHVARHTFATQLAIDNVPVSVISKLLGHKSTTTTQIYIHIAEDYMAREMMKLQRRFSRRPEVGDITNRNSL